MFEILRKLFRKKERKCLGCGSSFVRKGEEFCHICLSKTPSAREPELYPGMRWTCPICGKKEKEYGEMVPAFLNGWLGSAHRKCMRKYNKTHEKKYQVRKYSWYGDYLGQEDP